MPKMDRTTRCQNCGNTRIAHGIKKPYHCPSALKKDRASGLTHWEPWTEEAYAAASAVGRLTSKEPNLFVSPRGIITGESEVQQMTPLTVRCQSMNLAGTAPEGGSLISVSLQTQTGPSSSVNITTPAAENTFEIGNYYTVTIADAPPPVA
jgi:hypothetical protein